MAFAVNYLAGWSFLIFGTAVNWLYSQQDYTREYGVTWSGLILPDVHCTTCPHWYQLRSKIRSVSRSFIKLPMFNRSFHSVKYCDSICGWHPHKTDTATRGVHSCTRPLSVDIDMYLNGDSWIPNGSIAVPETRGSLYPVRPTEHTRASCSYQRMLTPSYHPMFDNSNQQRKVWSSLDSRPACCTLPPLSFISREMAIAKANCLSLIIRMVCIAQSWKTKLLPDWGHQIATSHPHA